MLALACVLTCQAAIVSDVLTVYNDNAAVVAQIGVNEDGSVFFTGFGALGTAGGSGTGCDPDATSCPLAGSEDPYLLMFINSSVIAPDPAWYGNGIVLHEPDGTFSDLVTVFNTGTDPDSGNPIYALGFYSGALGPFDGVTGSCPVGVGYPTNCDTRGNAVPCGRHQHAGSPTAKRGGLHGDLPVV